MIDRYLLRYFLAVIDHGNFSKAAAQCNVSQPTLSVGIAKLERLLDEISFDAPDKAGETFVITAAYVDEKVGTLAGNADLSKFIL